MREVVLDTETTGLDPEAGHRIVEIACLELINHVPTGKKFHSYVNPEREMPAEAFEIHGLAAEFLAKQPLFSDIAAEFLAFIGSSSLVIHNAEFDLKFINAELARLGHPELPMTRAIDTLQIARRKFPGAQASLDALCRRFEIDNAVRTVHGARQDTALLAQIYLEFVGGRQPGLGLAAADVGAAAAAETQPVRAPRPHGPSEPELVAHRALVARLKAPIWQS
ncbi:MAG: DNA polymerase III subunit epsilon [Alphaproteobacteria bacterium]